MITKILRIIDNILYLYYVVLGTGKGILPLASFTLAWQIVLIIGISINIKFIYNTEIIVYTSIIALTIIIGLLMKIRYKNKTYKNSFFTNHSPYFAGVLSPLVLIISPILIAVVIFKLKQ